MLKGFFMFLAMALAGSGILFISGYAGAASVFDIEYPIAELEGCADRLACKAYCNELSHQAACAAFAKKYGLIAQAEAKRAEKLPEVGPGGCRGHDECRQYCDDAAHQDECLEFGRRHGLISEAEARAAREVRQQKGPGGCENKEACEAYCADQARLEECVSFGEKHGFISREEAARIRKFGGGAGPGGCRGQDACRAYCEEESHQAPCIDFAEERGFMSRAEAARARKFLTRTGPGGCRGEQCRAYCENQDHTEECLEFAEREELIPKHEVARARKFLEASKQGGPGGCRARACEAYCRDESHREECFAFAKKHGLINPDEEKDFEVGRKLERKVKEAGGPGGCRGEGECRVYCSSPDHVEECIAFASAHGGVSPADARKMLENFARERMEVHSATESLDEMRKRDWDARFRRENMRQRGMEGFPGADGFQNFRRPGGDLRGPGGFEDSRMMRGPGGCSSPQECIEYCKNHLDECQNYQARPGNGLGRPDAPPFGGQFEGLGPRPGTNGIFQPLQRPSSPAEGLPHPPEGNFPLEPSDENQMHFEGRQFEPSMPPSEPPLQLPSSHAPRKGFFAGIVEFLLR